MGQELQLAVFRSAALQARSSGRDETDIGSRRLGSPHSGGRGKPRRPVEGSPGEVALVDRFDAPLWAFRAEGQVFIADGPSFPVSSNCCDGFEPTFSSALFGGRGAKPANPGLVPPDGLLGQCPRPTLHRFVAFLEAPGHVRVRDACHSWDQPCDETRARSTRQSGVLYPTLYPVAENGSGVLRIIERPYRHEPEEGPFHVETAPLGIAEGGK
jgi:hypothetical protein